MIESPMLLAAVLCANVALSEWLGKLPGLRYMGAALLVIVITAVQANLGLIPTYSPDVAVYEVVFGPVVLLAIFWLLLQVNLREVWRAGAQMIVLFLIGSFGIMLGVFAGMALVGGREAFGDNFVGLAGMFTGTYVGGSVNFNAIALHYRVVDDGILYAGANAVDAAMTTVWMIATVAAPKLLAPVWPRLRSGLKVGEVDGAVAVVQEVEPVRVTDLALLFAMGGAAVWGSGVLADWLKSAAGVALPKVLVLTTIALVVAQLGPVRKLSGYRNLGVFAVYVFLAVIGALCDLSAVAGLGELALKLTLLVCVIYLVHGTILFGGAALLRMDPAAAAVASQAGVGGGGTALALAKSLERPDLAVPGILVASLGTALGTYLGFAVSGWLA